MSVFLSQASEVVCYLPVLRRSAEPANQHVTAVGVAELNKKPDRSEGEFVPIRQPAAVSKARTNPLVGQLPSVRQPGDRDSTAMSGGIGAAATISRFVTSPTALCPAQAGPLSHIPS